MLVLGTVIVVGGHRIPQVPGEIALIKIHGHVRQDLGIAVGIGLAVVSILVSDIRVQGVVPVPVSVRHEDGKGLLAFAAIVSHIPGRVVARRVIDFKIIILVKVTSHGLQGPPQGGAAVVIEAV